MIDCEIQLNTETLYWKFSLCTVIMQESVYNFRLDLTVASQNPSDNGATACSGRNALEWALSGTFHENV